MKEREPMQLEIIGNTLTVTIKSRCCEGHICEYAKNYFLKSYFLSMSISHENDDILFKLAGIKDIYGFQKKILGYSDEDKGTFPHCCTREDVIKLVKAVVDYNNSQCEKENKGRISLR
ncbi:MAG: hypothetical protein K2H16_08415, partial [Prevotella sp.]|nr:hypothetical protein [Prevotella sp.]MDE6151348.1 hypothetical protein [Prevotella sp.]